MLVVVFKAKFATYSEIRTQLLLFANTTLNAFKPGPFLNKLSRFSGTYVQPVQ
jgi:hypothetical protein